MTPHLLPFLAKIRLVPVANRVEGQQLQELNSLISSPISLFRTGRCNIESPWTFRTTCWIAASIIQHPGTSISFLGRTSISWRKSNNVFIIHRKSDKKDETDISFLLQICLFLKRQKIKFRRIDLALDARAEPFCECESDGARVANRKRVTWRRRIWWRRELPVAGRARSLCVVVCPCTSSTCELSVLVAGLRADLSGAGRTFPITPSSARRTHTQKTTLPFWALSALFVCCHQIPNVPISHASSSPINVSSCPPDCFVILPLLDKR